MTWVAVAIAAALLGAGVTWALLRRADDAPGQSAIDAVREDAERRASPATQQDAWALIKQAWKERRR